MRSIILIVFLPLLASLIAGLGHRLIGKQVAKILTRARCSPAAR